MSMTLMAKAMSLKVGNPIRKLVLIKLADNANDKGECWPSYQHIADHCECGRSTVRDHIDALISMGFLNKENRLGVNNGKGNTSNVYYLNIDNPMPVDGTAPMPTNDIAMPPENIPMPVDGIAPMPIDGTRTSHYSETVIEPVIKQKTPLTPKGEFDEHVIENAKKALSYYNEATGLRCRDHSPFAELLTERKSRPAYTLQDIRTVIRWVVNTWKPRNGKYAKPANICRINRFDGYCADAYAWAADDIDIDCNAVISAYNAILGDRLPPADCDADRVRAVKMLAPRLAVKSLSGFLGYFEAFSEAPEFYFGGPSGTGWRANFDYLMRPEILKKTREGAL
ncbi:helix-turn-helix domain-containing protein [Martelella alba]|uniref:Helix-turn-helix domain-containing protein n=1 Tax=Martelella alba TaxID=2590451 RepID=A0ABY2SGD8_9HYPH|nr:helix-turn-helix domain-containing protein [Martelella alba]TKI02571.1 helix-turn-helix domain-containing protein [Martelella alba]